MIKAFVRKAMADRMQIVCGAGAGTNGSHGCTLGAAPGGGDPTARGGGGGELYRRLRRLDNLLAGPPDMHVGELALFAVDFGRGPDGGADRARDAAGVCAGFYLGRVRSELGMDSDRANQSELRAALSAHLAARDEQRLGRDAAPGVPVKGSAASGVTGAGGLDAVGDADAGGRGLTEGRC